MTDPRRLTEPEARALLEAFGLSIGRRLHSLYDEAWAAYELDSLNEDDSVFLGPDAAILAYNAYVIAQQPVDERGMVPVGELRDSDGNATHLLMIHATDGEMEVVH